ncbi:MAG: tRNA adenosine deaminase-associated protein [Propionibacteriaceae bacterium]|jgi:putative tRNA adenosine deaminase-associated protein|nr:tRNA adenosine deaminase-associated protein [Propionibacteriaceae bacterium]
MARALDPENQLGGQLEVSEDLRTDDDFDDGDDLEDDDAVDDEDDEDYDEDDDLEDARDDDIDFVVALYREDGVATVLPLAADLANDLDELAAQLQRLPGDTGAVGLVSLNREVLVAVRVRGPRHVQVLTSDIYYADVWPIVRDVADFHDLEPGEDDCPEDGPAGDLAMFASQGLSEMDLEAMCMEEDLASDELAERIVRGIKFDESEFQRVLNDYWEGEG